MKNYLNIYAAQNVAKFQMGGEMPQGQPAAAPAQGGQPNVEEMLMQYAESRDPQLAVAICDMLVEMMAAQQGAPAEGQPAPAMRNGGRMNYAAPMFRKGGRLA
jgi:hypothetical protein